MGLFKGSEKMTTDGNGCPVLTKEEEIRGLIDNIITDVLVNAEIDGIVDYSGNAEVTINNQDAKEIIDEYSKEIMEVMNK